MTDYIPSISAHFECDGTGVLVDSVAGDDWTELGTVPEIGAGKFGAARGPCAGVWNTGGDGFEITPNGVFETRFANGFRRGTQMGWFNLDSETGDNEFSSQAQASLSNDFQQYMVRANHQLDGGTNAAPVIFIWDQVTDTFAVVSGAGRGSAGLMPINTWCFLGWSVDLDTDVVRFFNGIPGEPPYYLEIDISSISAFRATLIGSALLGVGSGHSGALGLDGGIDHVDWSNNSAYVEKDFLYFWNKGRGRAWPQGYRTRSIGAGYYYR